MQIQCEKDGPHGDTAAIVPMNPDAQLTIDGELNKGEEESKEIPATASATIQ